MLRNYVALLCLIGVIGWSVCLDASANPLGTPVADTEAAELRGGGCALYQSINHCKDDPTGTCGTTFAWKYINNTGYRKATELVPCGSGAPSCGSDYVLGDCELSY